MPLRPLRLLSLARRWPEAIRYYTRSIWRKTTEDDVLFLASGLAFNGILTLIPILFLAAAVIGTILNSDAASMRQMGEVLEAIFPEQPFAEEIRSTIRGLLSDIITYRSSIGIAGFVVLLWTTTSLVDALRSALHRVYELKRTRGLLASLAHDVGFIALAFVLFILSNFSVWVYTIVKPWAMRITPLRPFFEPDLAHIVPTIIIILLTAIMFYIIYGYITDVRPPRRAAIISTITTTVLWIVAGQLFAVYLSDWSLIGRIYGPYAFLLVLLFWIYLSCLLFVFGGIVGQVYWERVKSLRSGNRAGGY
jgi:membrane protein